MKPNRYGGSRFNSGPKPQPQPNSQPTPAKPFSRKLKVEDFNLDALFENFMGSVSPAPKKLEERFWFYLDRKYSGATEHLLPLAKFISPLN